MDFDAAEDAILSEAEIDGVSEVIADFIDLKSPLIAGHSRAVAALVDDAARAARMPEATRAEMRRAALWHDIGYIAIGGTARFDTAEGSERSRLHPYFAGRMVPRAPGLAAIGSIIAEHHERLDGSGFHRGVRASDLSANGRLLAVAEAYQNLVEDRPFRVTLSPAQAARRLREEVKARHARRRGGSRGAGGGGAGSARQEGALRRRSDGARGRCAPAVGARATTKEIGRTRPVAEDGR